MGRRIPRSRRIAFAIAAGLILPLYRAVTKQTVVGSDNIPASGGFVAVANHNSNVDAITVGALLYTNGAPPHFLAKSQLFSNPVLARVLRALGQVPVYRGTGRASSSLDAALHELERGNCIVVFPEGTFTQDPELWPMTGRKGAARLALHSGMPLIPIAHWGGQRLLKPYTAKLRLFPRSPITALVGQPIDISDLQMSEKPAETVADEITVRIMDTLTDMLATIRGQQPPGRRWDMRTDEATHLPEKVIAGNRKARGLSKEMNDLGS